MSLKEKPYTTGEIASLSHVTINAVKKWIHSGKLEAFKTPGGHYRVKRDDFKTFINKYKFQIKDEVFPNKKKILIVDDEPAIVEFMKGAFVSGGVDYEIETASDGYEALIKIGSFEPDLLILDIRMPKIDGYEVCRRLKKEGSLDKIRILAVTAFGEVEMKNIVSAGADFCLAKPLKLEEVRINAKRLLL